MTTPDEQGPGGRVTRPRLDRAAPRRNILNAFRQDDGREAPAPAPPQAGGGGIAGLLSDDHVWRRLAGGAQESAPRNGAAPLADDADEALSAAYGVIDAQIEEGRRAAQRINPEGGGVGARQDLTGLLNRLVRTYSDFGSLWVDLVSVLSDRAEASRVAPGHAAAAGAAPMSLAVTVETDRPASARLRLYRTPTGALSAQPLRGLGAGAAEIAAVTLEPGPLLRIVVPAAAPDGDYHGVLLEEGADEPAGSVTLKLGVQVSDDG